MAPRNSSQLPAPSFSPVVEQRIHDYEARVRVGFPFWLRFFLFANVAAITLGRRIYVSPRVAEAGVERLNRLLRHELAHVRQVRELGLMRFLFRYMRDYIRLRRSGLTSHLAYSAIPFEVEAREEEQRGDLV